ncbi:DNA-directed primase/polymerase protein isoform X2 [Rhinatrema bivittatum]|uniref:DNA-directed primase/polymerase protein isoform X2 n=1 Tax=Rhinatrema bivittatum TaxID=194408 RepID=UPI001128BEE7|nr:DNA-directed primase/polymerase protein isoform X2 [Rhinatrema bivittatum]
MKRKWEAKLKQVEELALQYERKPLCSVYKPRLSNPWHPSSVWRLFYRQSQAFNFARSCKEVVHVFALEKENKQDGQRVYLVTTYTEFWFYYKEHRNNLKNCYEVIPENSVCKLYFDLEFYKPTNPEADGTKMVAKLIEYIIKKLEEIHGIKCSAEDVLNLDSSTHEKFSRHLIFILQNAAFKDNNHVGYFLNTVLQPALALVESKTNMVMQEKGTDSTFFPVSKRALEPNTFPGKNEEEISLSDTTKTWASVEGSDLSFLIVNDKESGKKLFADLAVYTKNRNFRLYKSSKRRKNIFLELAEDNKFVPKPQKNVSVEQQFFFSSLVSNVRFSDDLKILTSDIPEKERSVCLDSQRCRPSVTIEGYNFSPYPEIDCFILSLVKKEGVQGGIRRWNYFFLEELLMYDISNYRWCENIGRAHKSNNIMLLVDLKREVWYQKCHDPVCRANNFKSSCFPLPPDICLSFLFKEEEDDTSSMDEAGSVKERKIKLLSDQTWLSETKSVPLLTEAVDCTAESPDSDTDWTNGIEDEYCVEATEDAELVEAAENDVMRWDCEPEIPDKLLWEACQEGEAFQSKTYN